MKTKYERIHLKNNQILAIAVFIKMTGKKTQIFWNITPCTLVNSYRYQNDHSAFSFRVNQSKKIL